MNIKLLFAIISSVIGIIAFIPYLKDVWFKRTKPHIFTWIIWAISQGIATAGLLHGQGGLGVIPMAISVGCTLAVIILSIRNGDHNITKSDIAVLAVALSAIYVWVGLDSPLGSVLMVSGIDAIGYIPTFRKSYHLPWSETLGSWAAFSFADGLALLALEQYNLLTASYLTTITTVNFFLVAYLWVRRKQVKNNQPSGT